MSATWHCGEPQNGILWVRIEQADRPVNALSHATLEELSQLIERIEGDATIEGVVFQSSKPGTFIAGADVNEFKGLTDADAAREVSQFGQKVFQRLENLKKPTVALISGACLGGGLEFTLACKYRIADSHHKTLLGLPEVKLGLIPGWGGTVRLPQRIGLIPALPLILTGKTLNGYQARSRGLVHDVVPAEALESVGKKIFQTLRAEKSQDTAEAKLFRPRRQSLLKRLIENNRLVQKYALKQSEKQVLANTHGYYPAPMAAVQHLRRSLGQPREAAFSSESQTIGELAASPVTPECIRLFFLQEEAKKPPASLEVAVEPNALTRSAVIGAGAMGAGIALLLAKKGIWTRLKDIQPEFVANGMKNVRKRIRSDLKRRRLTQVQATNALDHLSPATDNRGLKHADIIIEAIIEDLDIKKQVFRELAKVTGPETVLATNTSSLLVKEIAEGVPHPERVVGLHFFNPPHRMPLVEVIHTEQTSPHALATALAVVSRLGKTKVVVKDCAGFLVNRLLSPYMNEAGYLLGEVPDPMEIERAAIEFGMPMGPLALIDLVGVGVAAHVSENIHEAYGERMLPAPIWERLHELQSNPKGGEARLFPASGKRKRLNKPVARIAAQLRKEQRRSGRPVLSREAIVQRLVYSIINEAARCLEEGIVERAEDIDLAMVFGTGFAPFRGGPLQYADSIGAAKIVEQLERFAVDHPRLEPSPALRRLAESHSHFCASENETEPQLRTMSDE